MRAQVGEKLDLLRAVAGDALCRSFAGLPPPLQPPPGLPAHCVDAISRVFPAPTLKEEAGEEEGEGEGEGADGEGGDGAGAAGGGAARGRGAAAAARVPAASLIQWSIPHQCFARLTPLLSVPGGPFTPPLMEGLAVSVGGLSESVVKHSGAALSAWAAEAARGGDGAGLQAVAAALAALLRTRPRMAWEAAAAGGGGGGGGGGGSGGGFDPSLSRWFQSILGAGAKKGGAGDGGAKLVPMVSTTHKVDARVIVPALRTLDTLLTTGALQRGMGDAEGRAWAVEVGSLVRKRLLTGKEDVSRVLASSAVLLGLLDWAGPPRAAALATLCDLLGHPYPLVRKTVAERAYVKLLTSGEDILEAGAFALLLHRAASLCLRRLCTPPPTMYNADYHTHTHTHTPAGSVEGVLALLSETPWGGELSAALGPRDALYPLFGQQVPAERMGTSAEDLALAAGAAASGGGGGGGGAPTEGYGALAAEAGY